MKPSRRRFLLLLAGLPAIAVSPLVHSKTGNEADGDQLGRHLISALADFPSAQIVGRRYLGSLKQKPDRRMLAQAVAQRITENKGAAMKLDRAALRRRIHSQCQKDYLTGQTVQLQGWLLPRTEVELCLLAVLFD